MLPRDFLPEIELRGFAICRNLLPLSAIERLIAALDSAEMRAGRRGLRTLLKQCPAVRDIAVSPAVARLATAVLGPDAVAVRAILFDKTPAANWGVGWHQDLTIAVKARVDVAGFTAWTVKDGVPHVQPPLPILEQMLTLRLHLDEVDAENGALVVMPGSHRLGRPADAAIAARVDPTAEVVCAASAGDVFAFRPLLLHMSRKSRQPRHRRVIQIEYAAAALPAPLAWYVR